MKEQGEPFRAALASLQGRRTCAPPWFEFSHLSLHANILELMLSRNNGYHGNPRSVANTFFTPQNIVDFHFW